MSRRLGVMLLLAALSLSGTATCPRGVMSCAVMQRATHDCCKHRTTLRSNDCCCKAAHQLTAQAVSTAPQNENVPVKFAAAPFHSVLCATDATHSISATHPRGRGADPPDTPVTQHTQLLL